MSERKPGIGKASAQNGGQAGRGHRLVEEPEVEGEKSQG